MRNILTSYDPGNGEVIGKVTITNKAEIHSIVEKARTAQSFWGGIKIDERIGYIDKAAKILAKNAQELGRLISREMGKNLNRGIGEAQGCAYDAVYRAEAAKEALLTKVIQSGGQTTHIEYNPLGICAVITPWNYPMSMGHWMIIPALTAGNTIVLKPSEETPMTAQAYADIFNQVLPEGVLQVVHGADEQGQILVESDVNLIAFTGSLAVGKDIMGRAAKSLKRLVMELGGKDPLIVLEDADIDQAARFAVASSFENSGQMCVSTERVFVDEGIADEFEKKVVRYASMYRIGTWNDPNAQIGPMINTKQRQKIISQLEEAIKKGAVPLLGGTAHPERFVLPTVLTNVSSSMKIALDETFGPVVSITRYKDLEAAVREANSSDFGLGAVVFGHKKAWKTAQKMEAGMVGINQGVGGLGDTPWVGSKQSGYGYHGSPDGHRQFAQVRVMSFPSNLSR